MKRKIILGAVLATSLMGLVACTSAADSKIDDTQENGKIKVMTSIYPVKEMTEIIGGDKVSVSSMVPDGAEPHDFEPKAKDMVSLAKSKLFIYNGLGMEHWVDKVLETTGMEELTIVDSSKNSNVILASNEIEDHAHEDEDEHSQDDGHNHGRIDPHIWLSPLEAKKQSKLIEEGLIKIDPTNKEYYTQNYDKFSKELDDLYTEYSEKFKTIQNKNFVTGHAAFAYLCRDFGLNQNSVEDAFGEGEVTPKHLKELSDYCSTNNVKVIFMPNSASEKLSNTLATEVGANVVKISSLETKNDNKSYIETMRLNLDTIYTSLN